MAIDPHNPYPQIPYFVDIPGVNIPVAYAATSSIDLPKSVSTSATQRIGQLTEIITKSKTSFALTGSDGARLGFGARVGAVTVFGTDGNPGSDTQAVDSRRQGTSVTTINQYDKLIFPLMRGSDNPLNNTNPFINFNSRVEAYGQPKLFHDPEFNSAKYAFTDFTEINPVTYIEVGGYYPAYPIVLDLPVYKDPDQMNGVIEVFDVRRSFSNTSITDYSFMKGAHGDLSGGYLKNKKGTSRISTTFEVKSPQEIDFFEDSQDLYFPNYNVRSGSLSEPGLELRKFAPPGLVSTGMQISAPYDDAVMYTTGSYDEFDKEVASFTNLLYGDGVVGPYSRMSAIGTRFKSATCGLQFGESNVLGTDSIAFGGLRK